MRRSLPFRPARSLSAVLVAVLATALSACSCGRTYTAVAVQFTPDGRQLLIASKRGLYAQAVPDGEPRELSDLTCGPDAAQGLACVRVSPDGSRLAALVPRGDETTRDLRLFSLADSAASDGSGSPDLIASDALDAAFTPDARDLVWAVPDAGDGLVRLVRFGTGGTAIPLVGGIWVGADDMGRAMDAVVLTRFGVAYPQRGSSSTQVWFKPFGNDDPFQAGTIPAACDGIQFSACVMANADGGTLAWQEKSSGILALFIAQTQSLLPLGQAWGFAFARTGRYALRIDVSSAVVQDIATGVAVRRVPSALSAQISADGETLAWVVQESAALKSVRLFSGSSRTEGSDHDLDVIDGPEVRALADASIGGSDIDLAMTGNAAWAVLDAKGSQPGSAKLVAVGLNSGEHVSLGEVSCEGCCAVAPAGALVGCAIESAQGGAALYLLDPVTGLRTTVSTRVIGAEFLFDGSGAAAIDISGSEATLVVALKSGRVEQLGSAVDFAVSGVSGYIAWVTREGEPILRALPR